jgi:diguanylate cyclase (GGDEF)-like protein
VKKKAKKEGSLVAASKLEEAKTSSEAKPARRLLVVDDEKDICELLCELLEDTYVVEQSLSGADGIRMLRRKPYDLVLTDLMMPGVNGLQVLKEAKEINPEIDVIVITGFVSIDSAVESMKLGASDYITKPFNTDQVKIVVKKTIERREFQRLAKEREVFELLSNTDGLTGLYNYRYLQHYLQAEIEREKRYRRHVSLMVVDIDDFKAYNDEFGHPAGDLALKRTARILKKATRGCDMVFRYGGEEFVVVLPETKKSEAALVGERIRQAFERETAVSGGEEEPLRGRGFRVTIGLAAFPADAQNRDELIDKADQALYQGKRTGKNCVYVFGSKRKFKPRR